MHHLLILSLLHNAWNRSNSNTCLEHNAKTSNVTKQTFFGTSEKGGEPFITRYSYNYHKEEYFVCIHQSFYNSEELVSTIIARVLSSLYLTRLIFDTKPPPPIPFLLYCNLIIDQLTVVVYPIKSIYLINHVLKTCEESIANHALYSCICCL